MKHILSLVFILSFLQVNAQNLAEKISSKADLVISVNGASLAPKIDIRDVDNSLVFKEIINVFFRGPIPINKVDEFGVDYHKRLYYVHEYGNDVTYNYLTYSISNLETFEKTIKENTRYKKEESKDGLNIVYYDYDTKLFWNADYAILINAEYIGREFSEYGWYWGHDDYYEQEYVTEEAVETISLEEMTQEQWEEYLRQEEERQLVEEEERRIAKEKKSAEQEERTNNRKNWIETEINARVKTFFSDELKNSKENLKLNINESADASAWYSRGFSFLDMMFMGRYMGYYNPYRDLYSFGNYFNGNIQANLFLSDKDIRLQTKITYGGKLQDSFEKVMSQKMNKKLTKFVSDSDLGFFSFSFDTEEMMNTYPLIIEEMAAIYDTSSREEFSIVADLFSLIVDEKAIAKAITGDAIFILHDVSQKEMEYMSYEYDENYNYEEVLSTRVETMPDFTFLMGTLTEDLVNKVFRISVKHQLIEPVSGGYKLVDKRNRNVFKMYFALKNDILFAGTSEEKLVEFNAGGTTNKLSAEKLKMITKNSGAIYLDLKTLMTKILQSEYLSNREKRFFSAMQNDLTEITGTMKFNGGSNEGNFSVAVPAGEKNAAYYALHFFDHLIKAEKN